MPLITTIPERYETGFAVLNSLSKSQFDEIKKILPSLDLTYSIESLSENLSSKKLARVNMLEIFRSVGSLIPFIDNEEMIKEVAEDIVFLIDINEIFKIENKEVFLSRLLFFLTDKHIYYASKSEDLIDNYGNVYILSRTLSDIRTVFDLNVEQEPKAGFIIHNLSIHYQSIDEPFHKDISIQLTSSQIQELKETLIRAERKEKMLKSVLKNSNIKNLIE